MFYMRNQERSLQDRQKLERSLDQSIAEAPSTSYSTDDSGTGTPGKSRKRHGQQISVNGANRTAGKAALTSDFLQLLSAHALSAQCWLQPFAEPVSLKLGNPPPSSWHHFR